MGKKRLKNLLSFWGGKSGGKQRILSVISPQAALNALLAMVAVATVIMAFVLMERYVKERVFIFENGVAMELVGVPPWVNKALKQKVYDAAIVSGGDLKLDENMAQMVQENIVSKVAWLDNPQVQITHNSFRVRGKWRKPLALVKSGTDRFYVDADLVVLDFVPVKNLPIVAIRGVSGIAKMPAAGEVLQNEDLSAAVALLERLDRMDRITCPKRPLLYEIEGIDISNFKGRQSNKFPHIVLFSKDNTQIIWGAELDNWHRHLEATDEEKLAKLYSYYKENHSLSGKVQRINLRDPQEVIQPIDKY